MIGGLERFLPGECIEERTEFIQSLFRVGGEFHAQPVFRLGAPDLVTAILAEFIRDRVLLDRKIGHQ